MYFRTVGPRPQTALLLEHFRTTKSISGLEAAALYRIKSLPRRIMDLKREGHEFQHEVKQDATGQRYVRYHYLGRKQSGLVQEATHKDLVTEFAA